MDNGDKGPQLLATALTTATLASIAVGIRIWSRKRSKAGLWWDDWTIVASLVGSLFPTLLFHPNIVYQTYVDPAPGICDWIHMSEYILGFSRIR